MPHVSQRSTKKKSLMAAKDSALQVNDWSPGNVWVKKETVTPKHTVIFYSQIETRMAEMRHSILPAHCGCSTSRLPSNPGTDWTNLGESGQWIPNPLMFPQLGVCLLCGNLPSSKKDLFLLSKRCRISHEKMVQLLFPGKFHSISAQQLDFPSLLSRLTHLNGFALRTVADLYLSLMIWLTMVYLDEIRISYAILPPPTTKSYLILTHDWKKQHMNGYFGPKH